MDFHDAKYRQRPCPMIMITMLKIPRVPGCSTKLNPSTISHIVSYRVLKVEVKEKIRYILQFFFDKGENASQVAEIVNGIYGSHTVTANYVQIWFRRFRSGIFDVKDAPRTGRPVVENVNKITKIIKVDRHVLASTRSSRSTIKQF
ncbi:histone-lysine N-methyltransferase SETMAR [Trichonephila clavipes]|nr:histone-lysine N-methyltransferase SETMAR [Trichonephila clavipes]